MKKGSSLDGVEEAVRYMEDVGVFNAGRGSCLTVDGKVQLDVQPAGVADRHTIARDIASAAVCGGRIGARVRRAQLRFADPIELVRGAGLRAIAGRAPRGDQ